MKEQQFALSVCLCLQCRGHYESIHTFQPENIASYTELYNTTFLLVVIRNMHYQKVAKHLSAFKLFSFNK